MVADGGGSPGSAKGRGAAAAPGAPGGGYDYARRLGGRAPGSAAACVGRNVPLLRARAMFELEAARGGRVSSPTAPATASDRPRNRAAQIARLKTMATVLRKTVNLDLLPAPSS